MKTLIASILITLSALSAISQSATQVVVVAIVRLSNGMSYTNLVANSNTNILAAATNSMTAFNLIRASQDPPKVATTNLSQYFIEFTKEQFNLIKNEYDFKMSQDLNVKLQSLSEAQKDKIRALINAP